VHERRVERGRVRIKLGWNVEPADPAFAAGQNEPRWIKPGLGDDRRIARGGTFRVRSMAARAFVWLLSIQSSEGPTSARRDEGSRLSAVAVTLAVVNGASEGKALRVSPDSSIGWGCPWLAAWVRKGA
jgi:hypothetical protein